MRPKAGPFAENIAEATAACLVTMVQGNLLVLGVGHWLIASRTGLVAGGVASVVLLLARTERRWLVSLTLGVVTAAVDFVVHPGSFGAPGTEAIVTGAGAAVLSYAVGAVIARVRSRRGADVRPPAS